MPDDDTTRCILCKSEVVFAVSEFDAGKPLDLYSTECATCGRYHFERELVVMSISDDERSRVQRSLLTLGSPSRIPVLGWFNNHIYIGWRRATEKPTPETQGD